MLTGVGGLVISLRVLLPWDCWSGSISVSIVMIGLLVCWCSNDGDEYKLVVMGGLL